MKERRRKRKKKNQLHNMDQLTPEQIKERFDRLPKELQAALSSNEIHEKIRDIGEDQGLMIDQVGELVDQVGLVILGVAKSSDFVADTSRRLSINSDRAQRIAEKINTEIFENLKNELTERESSPEIAAESGVSSLERAGGFEIERTSMRESSLEDKDPVTSRDRNDILAGLENPAPVVPRMTSSGASVTNGGETRSEPLVEQLLRSSTAIPEEKINHEPNKSEPKPPATNDPYREAVI